MASRPSMALRWSQPACLYPDEAEIARLVVGPDRARIWPATAIVLERSGLPKVDVVMGGRYWPAVIAFFDRYNRIAAVKPAGRAQPTGRRSD